MQDLVVFGSIYPDLVKLVGAINRVQPQWRLLGFIDDRDEARGSAVLGVPVLGTRAELPRLARAGASFFNNVSGQVVHAQQVAALLEALDRPLPSLVHPGVDLGHVTLGRGCVLADGCCVGSGVRIGNYLAARMRVVISHDVSVGDHVFIGPGAVIGGGATLESGAFIGVGATVMGGCRVGAHSVIGAGALVAEDVPPGMTVAGVRGRVVRAEGRS